MHQMQLRVVGSTLHTAGHGLLWLHHCPTAAVWPLCIPRSIPGVSSKLLVFLQAPAAAAAAPAAAGKETPQERLKRLMQAQLNKAAQKDSLAVAQRKIQVCTGPDRVAAELLLLLQDTLLPGDAGRGVLFLGQEGLVCARAMFCGCCLASELEAVHVFGLAACDEQSRRC